MLRGRMMGWKRALFYEKLGECKAKCTLCHLCCVVSEGQNGFCNAYTNVEGDLYSVTYGRPVIVEFVGGIGVSPFARDYSRSPLFNRQLRVATTFCNFRCKVCSNHRVAFRTQPPLVLPGLKGFQCFNGAAGEQLFSVEMSPEDIVDGALRLHCTSICFTYNEPTIFFEYLLDICRLARKVGLAVYVETNGYVTQKPIEVLAPYVDSIIVSFKASGSRKFFDGIDVPHLLQRFQAIRRFKELGVWTIVYDLLVEGFDSPETVTTFCRQIVSWFGADERLFFGVAGDPALEFVPPIEERQKKFEWALACAFDAGLRDVMFTETIHASRLKQAGQ